MRGKSIIVGGVIFSAGAIAGTLVSTIVIKKKLTKEFDEKLDREIDETRKFYNSKKEKLENAEVPRKEPEKVEELKAKESINEQVVEKKQDLEQYARILKEAKYDNKEIDVREVTAMAAYVIHPDEFGKIPGYDLINMTYYEGDGVLVDDIDDEEIEDIESLIGPNALKHFGEYEYDIVDVRNDVLKADYEIVRTNEAYRK